jgi:hypothetical protein
MAARKSMFKPAPARPEVDRLFADAKRNPPTEKELMEQRVSFAYGNAPVDATGITKASVEDSSRRIRIEHAN